MNYRKLLEDIDKKCFNDDTTLYNLTGMFDAVILNEDLSYQDRDDIKKVIDATKSMPNDKAAETIAAVLAAKENDKNESLTEDNENQNWDSSRAIDVARYCYDKDYAIDKAFLVVRHQLKKEGSVIPNDNKEIERIVCNVYDDLDNVNAYDESLSNVNKNESLKESYITTVGEVIEGSFGNMDDAQFDNDLKSYKKIARFLKVKNSDNIVVAIFDDDSYNPKYFDINPQLKLADNIIAYDNCVYEDLNSNYYMYFKSEEDANNWIEKCDNFYNNDNEENLDEDYHYTDDSCEQPYSYSEVEKELKSITNNWSDKEGAIRCYCEQEKKFGVLVLKHHYKVVEPSDGRMSAEEKMSWVIAYSNPMEFDDDMEEDFSVEDNQAQMKALMKQNAELLNKSIKTIEPNKNKSKDKFKFLKRGDK